MVAPIPRAERRFYAEDRAMGRFGMRLFRPQVMPEPHWHGHVEANFLTRASMTYLVGDQRIEVPSGHLVLFWTNLPHQLVWLTSEGEGPTQLATIYLPLDVFLYMPHLAPLQVTLLSGGLGGAGPRAGVAWAGGDLVPQLPQRQPRAARDPVRGAQHGSAPVAVGEPTLLLQPMADPKGARKTPSASKAHVVAMVRLIMENLAEPMSNADVARVTGLHENYALSLFTSVMQVPMRRFIIHMRLPRARALLLESNARVATVAL